MRLALVFLRRILTFEVQAHEEPFTQHAVSRFSLFPARSMA
jgi:hypothetical protein